MKRLYEFSPGEIYTSFRGFVPHVKNALNSAGNAIKIASKKSPNKKISYRELIKQLYNCSKNDPTLFGDAVRGSETARQALGIFILQNLPPLPTADTQSIKQTIESLLHTISRGESNRVFKGSRILNFLHKKFGINPNNAPGTMKRALSKPAKTSLDFVGNRATASTYASSPITNYNSNMLGLYNMPVLVNNVMEPFQATGMNPITYAKNTYNWAMGGLRDKAKKIREYSFLK